MPDAAVTSLIAIDIGNTHAKAGRFDRSLDCEANAMGGVLPVAGPPLPTPVERLGFDPAADADAFTAWLEDQPLGELRVAIASVNHANRERVEALLEAFARDGNLERRVTLVTPEHLPLVVRVPEPGRVGIDRLVGAVAANRLRRPEKPAVVVDLGTAITVDLIAADGAFEGGAILPGVAMAARALHQQTDLLPERPMRELDASPDAVGKNTADAIDAGLFWGAVGAVREVIARQSDRLTTAPQVFVTGGAAPSVARLLGGPDTAVRHVPDLVLSGIAVASDQA
ncbi:MAG: type III pantothenate kinase [Planctomycetota bacterium]